MVRKLPDEGAARSEGGRGGFGDWVRRLAAPSQELFAEGVRHETDVEATPVEELQARRRVTVAGRLRTVVMQIDGRSPSVEAELFDGTGQVLLVWMGRRRIVGLEPGTRLVARGRVAQGHDGRLVIYNPTYELRPPGR